MSNTFKLQKKFFALSSLISLFLNILQPAFIAMTMAPVLSPAYAVAQEVPTVDSTPSPTTAPTVAPSVEPTVSPSATPEIIATPTPVASVLPSADPSSTPMLTIDPSETPLSSVAPITDSSPAPPSPESSPLVIDQNEHLQITVVDNTVATSISEIDLTVTETGSAVLSTDKLDYAPTDTALITGAGFIPNTLYLLTISSTDDPATSTTVDVQTDETGKLFYAYQLDGIYRPNYKIEAFLAGALVATVTFTDSAKQAICHATSSNTNPYVEESPNIQNDGSLAGGHLNHLGGIYPATNWGDIIPPYNQGNFHYPGMNWTSEGQAIFNNNCDIPLKPDLTVTKTNDVSGSVVAGSSFNWTLTVSNIGKKDASFSNNEVVLEDNLPTGVSYGAPTDNKSNFSCSIISNNLVCKATSNITIAVNGSITITVPVTTISSGTLQNPRANGICEVDPDDKESELNESNNTCSNTITVTSPTGTITVVKNTIGGDGTFAFTTTGNGLSNFSLTTTSNIATKTFSNVTSGTYSVTETVPSGWSMSSNCTGTTGSAASFTLTPGGAVTCTFTNTKLPTLTVNKILNSISPTESGKFNLRIDGTTYATNIGNNGTTGAREVSLGQHTVSETAGTSTNLSNYMSVIGGDCTQDGKITLSAGDNKVCTITNTRKSGKILIDKILGSGDVSTSLWDFTISGIGTFKDGDFVDLATGTFTITESNNVPGYSLSMVDGACSNRSGNSATLTVNQTTGDDFNTCSFTNTRDTGSLRVNKQVDLNGDGDFRDDHEQSNSKANQLGFRWSLNSTAFNKQMGETIYDIPTSIPNTVSYSVAENEIDGYHLAGWSLNGSCREPQTSSILVPITKNTTTTLTLCNVHDTGSITIVKDATPNSDEEFEFESNKFHDFELVDGGREEGRRDHDEHDSNSKKFEDIITGEYKFEEESKHGWTLDSVTCEGAEEYDVRGSKLTIDLQNYEDVVCTFHNVKNPVITVDKVTNPSGSKQLFAFELERVNDNYDDRKSSDHDEDEGNDEEDHDNNSVKFNLMDESRPKVINTFGGGSFKLSESPVEGWETTDITCGGVEYESDLSDRSVIFYADVADEVECTFTNTAWGDLEVTKYNDLNGDGNWDEGEPTLEGVEIYIDGRESQYTGKDGTTTFENLVTDSYLLGEDLGEDSAWRQTAITCDDDDRQESKESEDQDSKWVYISAGETTYCQIGNQERPNLTIAKSNDATGNKNSGDLVRYTLTLHLLNSNMTNINVTDVTPEGFAYVAGSWSASLNGLPFTLPEPDYGSPGVWHLESLEAGDTVELSYYAKVQDGLDAGSYYDTAWASGESATYGTNYLALGTNSTYVDGNFVGTRVAVNKNYQQTGNVAIESQVGEVLGASTQILPATGVNSKWLLLAIGLLLTGLLFIFGGKMFKKSLMTLVILASVFSFAPRTLAADPDNNLSVRIEQPASPMRVNDWKLSYSVLDRAGLTPVVYCYVKKPGASLFTSFDVAHTSIKASGDNASCKVDGGVMSADGEYQFYVTAISGSNSENSDTVVVKYDTSGPGEPNYYAKDHPSSCKYVIRFHTADDASATSKVEIYSSDSKTFDTNSGTRVGTVNIGSNQDGTFTHDRADNCDREWYYVIRAFDASGNQSSHRGDEVTIASSSTSNYSSSIAPAIVRTTSLGSILGSKTEEGETSESNAESALESPEASAGEVLGEEQDLGNKNTKYLWILLIVGASAIIYVVTRNKNMAK